MATRKKHTIHKTDMQLNKYKLKCILDDRKIEYKELHQMVCDKFGLDLSYKGFNTLLMNRASWKLLYAHAVADVLNLAIVDIFDVVEINVEEKAKKLEEWKKKYQN